MRYPTLNAGQTDELVRQLIKGEETSIHTVALWRGDGETIDLDDLEDAIYDLRERLKEIGEDPALTSDKDPFEGEVAAKVFPFLNAVPIEVLDDLGFWRYLSVRYFWWFVSWRESGPIESGNVATYTSANRNTEQIPLRLYLRAKAIQNGDDLTFASTLEKSTDFWRSHVIRVRTGTAPKVARAFVSMQKETHLPTETLREYARRLNRTWTNVNLNLLTEDQAEDLIKELRD